jgi:UDP-N-acetylglucosamine 1-carboxyvinyltransferase
MTHDIEGDVIRVEGGKRLSGSVVLSGSKNGSLPLLAATLLMDGRCDLSNLATVEDVRTMVELLRSLGLKANLGSDGKAVVESTGLSTDTASMELGRRMRASFWIAGPMLARLGRAAVPLPGGCDIGTRPVNFHLDGFQALGARYRVEHGYVYLEADRLRGTTIYFDARYRSVGATINIALAACLAEGTTILENAAREPEVVDLCRFLEKMGANISGAGSGTLRIEGVNRLAGARHQAISDRIEAGTLLLAAGMTCGDVAVGPIAAEDLPVFGEKLREAGVEVTAEGDSIRAAAASRPKGVDISTGPFPLFATDLQPPWVAMACISQGIGLIEETMYDARLSFVDELRRMGADVRVANHLALVRGVERLTGAKVRAQNIRAGAALVLAALAAEGESEISGRHAVLRGYDRLEEKLASLGAKIEVA